MARDESGDAFRGVEADRAERARENAEAKGERAAKEAAEAAALAALGVTAASGLPDPTPGARFVRTIDPPMEFAITPILPRGEVIEVNGGHGRLKSTLALAWALSVATGRSWGPYAVTKGKVCFISMEDRARILRSRIYAWLGSITDREERQRAIADLDVNFSCLTRETAASYNLTSIERGKVVRNEPVIAKLKEIAAGHSLVILETTARLHGGEEDNTGLMVFGLAVEEIVTQTGTAIVVIRHQSKSDARAQTSDSYSGRGGGALADMARGVFVVTRPDVADPKERDLRPIVLFHAKTTIGAPQPPMYWKPEVVTLSNGDTPVFLRQMTKVEIEGDTGKRIVEKITETFPEGITRDALVKAFPAADRGRVRKVIDELVKIGDIVEVPIKTTGRPARGYQLPDWTLRVVEGGEAS